MGRTQGSFEMRTKLRYQKQLEAERGRGYDQPNCKQRLFGTEGPVDGFANIRNIGAVVTEPICRGGHEPRVTRSEGIVTEVLGVSVADTLNFLIRGECFECKQPDRFEHAIARTSRTELCRQERSLHQSCNQIRGIKALCLVGSANRLGGFKRKTTPQHR